MQFKGSIEEVSDVFCSGPWDFIQQNQLTRKQSIPRPQRRSISSEKYQDIIQLSQLKPTITHRKSKDDYPITNQEHFELRLIQAEISDFVIIEPLKNGKQYQVLGENDWKRIIQQKSLAGYNMLDIHVSLLTQNIQFCSRRDIWLLFCQIDVIKEKLKTKNQVWEELQKLENPYRKQIEKDLPRALNGGEFMNKENQFSLKKILMAYANYDPELGYTQGMNIIAANLLICYDLKTNDQSLYGKLYPNVDVEIFDPYRDETVFQIFIYIMVELNWRSVFMPGFPGLVRMMKLFQMKLASELPLLSQHFQEKDVDLNICFQQQYLSLLMYGISWDISRMIFDLFLFEGEAIIHSFLIGMLKYCQDTLLKLQTFDVCIHYNQEILRFCRAEMIKQFYDLFSIHLYGQRDLTNTLINLGFIRIQGEFKEPVIKPQTQKVSKIQQIKSNTNKFLKQFFTKKN